MAIVIGLLNVIRFGPPFSFMRAVLMDACFFFLACNNTPIPPSPPKPHLHPSSISTRARRHLGPTPQFLFFVILLGDAACPPPNSPCFWFFWVWFGGSVPSSDVRPVSNFPNVPRPRVSRGFFLQSLGFPSFPFFLLCSPVSLRLPLSIFLFPGLRMNASFQACVPKPTELLLTFAITRSACLFYFYATEVRTLLPSSTHLV